ncbi:GDP-6-deoxy-D-mannose reductase [Photobacterium piscicola]|uniref:GDP-6-deoxy-D-mannose reductase n=1 Tax=Photobacterium piscicola TaxID=1378299 RepID=A0A1T5I1U3_9GAMM|nr:NAD-dependent epimerase/dehydratase family protein [Photobacterium piscicola]SKC33047.1 GDP-6-deoxy-D-mannose reductase [Photobacterium piscicola]
MVNRILLTGASGFIGSYLKKSDDILAIVIRKNEIDNCKPNYEIDGLTENTCWDNAFNNIDSIIHLAGLAHSNSFSESDYIAVNTQGTLKLASDAAKAGVKRFVFVSSIGVNGSSTEYEKPFCYYSEVEPHNTYAKSKLDAEIGLKKIAKETGLEVVIVRPTLVYGPNAPGNFGLLTKLVTKLPLLPFGLVNNKRSFIAVQNLTDLLLTCAKHPDAAGHTFLASDGKSISTKEFTNAIAKGLNKSIYQLPVPASIMRLGAKLIGKQSMAEQLLDNLEVDSSNAFDVMGWKPPYTMEQAMNLLSKEMK